MPDWYNEDLAYIHDTGFQDYALQATSEIVAILQRFNLLTGLVVDLGCGSGLSAQLLHQAGYSVLGIDISAAMIAIAQQRIPTAEFRVESLFAAEIPACTAVISIGEGLSYLFDDHADGCLDDLFRRIYDALCPGGVFIFDVVVPGQVPPGEIVKSFVEGKDWLVLVEKQEDLAQQLLARRIITLRQVEGLYRRTDEVHRQRLFDANDLAGQLTHFGFQVKCQDRYGDFKLPPARIASIARKPLSATDVMPDF